MIQTEQTVTVDCGIEETWAYARDFQRWASIMPGYQSCEVEDEDNSLWVLKVSVGAMVRTVKVRVHVDEWAGPERVDFSFSLEGDPVVGGGSYLAKALGPGSTDMTLRVQVQGSGAMAPMWEAMGAPVLPVFAKAFAEQLKKRIEEFNAGADPATAEPARPTGFAAWLRRIWKSLFGPKESASRQIGSNS